MGSFGVKTDIWGFATAGIESINSSAAPQSAQGQCLDSHGNVTAETVYDTGKSPTQRYRVCKGTTALIFDTATAIDFRLGKVINGNAITSIVAEPSNSKDFEIEIGGENSPLPDSQVAKFTPLYPPGYLAGGKNARLAGAVQTVGSVLSSSINASVTVSKGLDSQGNQSCKEVSAGRMEATNELTTCDTAIAVVADTANGWTGKPTGDPSQEQTGYPTLTFEAFQNLAED